MPAERLDVEILIVNTNNRDRLRGCLHSLTDGCGDVSWRATVVDNASEDGSSDLVAETFPGIELIRNDRRAGISENNNAVLRRVLAGDTARYFLAMHEDVELAPGCVAALAAYLDTQLDVGAVGPRLVDEEGRPYESIRRFPTATNTVLAALHPRLRFRRDRQEVWLDAPCILYRVEAVRQVGLFDERFFGFYEETDLARRLLRAGWTVKLCAEARAVHRAHGTWGRADLKLEGELRTLRSRYIYDRKHHGAVRALTVATLVRAALLARAAKATATATLTRDADEAGLGRQLLSLARFDPSKPMPLEDARS